MVPKVTIRGMILNTFISRPLIKPNSAQHQRQDDYHKSGQAVGNVQGGGKHAAQCQLTADRHVTSAADHDHGVTHHHNAKRGIWRRMFSRLPGVRN